MMYVNMADMKPLVDINLTTSDSSISLNKETGESFQCKLPKLNFQPITISAMEHIMPFLELENGRTTDYSYLGMLMWTDRFDYQYEIVENTLFIKGRLEDDRRCVAFSLPLGDMNSERWMATLRNYCHQQRIKLRFSAIPEHAVPIIQKYLPTQVHELTQWADYIYDAKTLSSLSGKKMGKKRNHVNKFMKLFSDKFHFRPITPDDIPQLLKFMDHIAVEADNNESANSERELTRTVLEIYSEIADNVEGAILTVNDEICAFTIGDIKGDTLYIHIEKALREFDGAAETINKLFAEAMTQKYPNLKYINREDDAGDPGLRKSKQSYYPIKLLSKFNLLFG